MFNSMEEIRNLNARVGLFFFQSEWMLMMDSTIESDVLYGCFFITRECNFDRSEHFYSIREALPDGRINTIGGFQQFETKGDAIDYLEEYVEAAIAGKEIS